MSDERERRAQLMNARRLPATAPRVETGPVMFGDDWTGVFIRGDNAMHYSMMLQLALASRDLESPMIRQVLEGLLADLKSCNEANQ